MKKAVDDAKELSEWVIAAISLGLTVFIAITGCIVKIIFHARKLHQEGLGYGDFCLDAFSAFGDILRRQQPEQAAVVDA